MRFRITDPCNVGATLPDGTMSAMPLIPGDILEVAALGSYLGEDELTKDIELFDGTLLLEVPLAALELLTSAV